MAAERTGRGFATDPANPLLIITDVTGDFASFEVDRGRLEVQTYTEGRTGPLVYLGRDDIVALKAFLEGALTEVRAD